MLILCVWVCGLSGDVCLLLSRLLLWWVFIIFSGLRIVRVMKAVRSVRFACLVVRCVSILS